MSRACVVVHVGAGYHSPERAPLHQKACHDACSVGMQLIKERQPASVIVKEMIKILENHQCTNAGIGSNLNRIGQVECDASVMEGETGAFGAVASLQGVKNAIEVAFDVMEGDRAGPQELGLIPPMLLCGEGARRYAIDRKLSVVYPDCTINPLVTEKSKVLYLSYMKRLQDFQFKESNLKRSASSREGHEEARLISKIGSNPRETRDDHLDTGNEEARAISKINSNPIETGDLLLDTVGAICRDLDGNVSAGVSSGGIALKMPGRIGEAALPGCGCWAQDDQSDSDSFVKLACSVSGCGEHIMKFKMAERCCTDMEFSIQNCNSSSASTGNDKANICNEKEKVESGEQEEEEADDENEPNLFDSVHNSFKKFLASPFLKNIRRKLCGLVILCEQPFGLEVVYGHSSPSFALGYMREKDKLPTTKISRLPDSKKEGTDFLLEGFYLT